MHSPRICNTAALSLKFTVTGLNRTSSLKNPSSRRVIQGISACHFLTFPVAFPPSTTPSTTADNILRHGPLALSHPPFCFLHALLNISHFLFLVLRFGTISSLGDIQIGIFQSAPALRVQKPKRYTEEARNKVADRVKAGNGESPNL
jgi:hypothetical protein